MPLKSAWRGLRKSPGFTATAVLTLALGIGGNTAIFTVIRAVLLRPLDFRDPGRLAFLALADARRHEANLRFGEAEWNELRANTRSFTGIAAFCANPENVSLAGGGQEPQAIKGARVSANFLEVLGVQPVAGRGFLPAEDVRGGPAVALISAALWRRRFGGDPRIAGRGITLDATPYTVVGVLPPGFEFPFAGVDVWVPRPSEWSSLPPRFWGIPILNGVARLRPGVTLDQARAELQVRHREYLSAHPASRQVKESDFDVVWLKDRLVAGVRPTLTMLFGAVACVLLIACANVAALLLARAAARSHEFAIRAALGAGRGRLLRQTLAESALLAAAGGAAGLLVAAWALSGFQALDVFHRASGNALYLYLPGAGALRPDALVLAFTAALSLASALLFGMLPAWRASRPDLAGVLRERAAAAAARVRVRALLVIGQVALSIVLLIGAGLLLKSAARLRAVAPGFQPARLLTMKIALPARRYGSGPARAAFFADLVRRVQALPGVSAATVALSLPATTNTLGTNVQAAGQPLANDVDQPVAQLQSVAPGYFHALGIGVVRGRPLTAADNAPGAPPVALVNESFARRFWPDYPRGVDPVGQHFSEGADRLRSVAIVGVVADVRERGLAADTSPEFYVPIAVHPPQTAYLAARVAGDPLRLANAVRAQVWALDPDQPVSEVETMDALLDAAMGQRRLTMTLLAAFAAIALLLAVVGIYGVSASAVAQRTREVGIRRALGAQHGDILRLVLGQALALAASGVLLGLAGSWALAGVMRRFLFHVAATDPATFAAVALLFPAVALAAGYLPARRAARIDPMSALRYE